MKCDQCKEQAQDGFDLCRICMENYLALGKLGLVNLK